MSDIAPDHHGTHLWDLPQEIQDLIFESAYPKVDAIRVINKKSWEWRKKSSASSRPFIAKVEDFFGVSKRFFFAAATAWIQNQHCWDYCVVALMDSPLLKFRVHYLNARCSYWRIRYLSTDFPAVKHLRLEVEAEDLQPDDDKAFCAWKTQLGEEDIKKTTAWSRMRQVSGLLSIKILPYQRDLGQERHSAILDNNLAKFAALIKQIVTRPRDMPPPPVSDELARLEKVRAMFGSGQLQDHEIVDNSLKLHDLVVQNPGKVVAWMQSAKKQLSAYKARQ